MAANSQLLSRGNSLLIEKILKVLFEKHTLKLAYNYVSNCFKLDGDRHLCDDSGESAWANI